RLETDQPSTCRSSKRKSGEVRTYDQCGMHDECAILRKKRDGWWWIVDRPGVGPSARGNGVDTAAHELWPRHDREREALSGGGSTANERLMQRQWATTVLHPTERDNTKKQQGTVELWNSEYVPGTTQIQLLTCAQHARRSVGHCKRPCRPEPD